MFKLDITKDKEKAIKQRVEVRKLVTESYNPKNLNLQVISPKVNFLNGYNKSYNIPDYHFTNFLPYLEQGACEPYIEQAFKMFKDDKSIILKACSDVNYSGKNKERIKQILLHYITEEKFEDYKNYIRKSDIVTNLNVKDLRRGAFRVISIYSIEPKTHKKQKHSKHTLTVICLDPFHLFLPSRHEEDGIKYTSDEAKIFFYEKFKEYKQMIYQKYPLMLNID